MKKTIFVISIFLFFLVGCNSSTNREDNSMEQVKSESLKQEIEKSDSIAKVSEEMIDDINNSSEKLDSLLKELEN
jgi:uncharacterized protein YcfL